MRTITKAQYLQFVGLHALSVKHVVMLSDIEEAMEEIAGDTDQSGHISDMIYGSRDLDEGLRILGVTVAEE